MGRVLMIGGAGFIGQAAVRKFADAGYKTTIFDRVPPTSLGDHQGFFAGSITDRAALAHAFETTAPDLVVSFAAHSAGGTGLSLSADADHSAAMRVNVDGLRNVIDICRNSPVSRVIWLSSTTVLGADLSRGRDCLDEDASCRPSTWYGLTKRLAEEISAYARREFRLDVAAVRPTLVIGPNHPYSGLLDPIKKLISGSALSEPLAVRWGHHRFDVVHVDDVARALLALANKQTPLSSCYHVNGGATTFKDLVDVARSLRPEVEIDWIEEEASTVFPLVTSQRITDETGFQPRFTPSAILRDCFITSNQQWGKVPCLS